MSDNRPSPLYVVQQALSPYLYSEHDDGAECTQVARRVVDKLTESGYLIDLRPPEAKQGYFTGGLITDEDRRGLRFVENEDDR